MAGPARSPPSARPTTSTNPLGQPPRPPNAWILYRSDKLKSLTPPPPGAPRRPQADISKTISAMWKNETTAVRNYYERLSDIKKAEHQAMYPGYRFQPVKKADRERMRNEQKLEKEREKELNAGKKAKRKPASAPASAAPTADASEPPVSPFSPDLALPSAPLPSTLMTPRSPADFHALFNHGHDGSCPFMPPTPTLALPGASQPPLFDPQHQYPPPPLHASLPPLSAPHASLPLNQQLDKWTFPDGTAHRPVWNSCDGQFHSLDQAFQTFSFPRAAVPIAEGQPPVEPIGWLADDADVAPVEMPTYSGADPALHAQLVPTDDPGIFQLTGIDNHQLLSHPDGEIELSMGAGFGLDGGPADFSAFSSLFNMLGPETDDGSPPEEMNDLLNSFLALSQDTPPEPSLSPPSTPSKPSAESPVAAVKREDSLSSKASSSPVLSPSQPNTPASIPLAPTPPKAAARALHSSGPYTPPAGAALAATRRVAATWAARAS